MKSVIIPLIIISWKIFATDAKNGIRYVPVKPDLWMVFKCCKLLYDYQKDTHMRKCVNEFESFSQIRNTEIALLDQTYS